MDFQEREGYVRRISDGKLYGNATFLNEEYDIIIKDPNLDVLNKADWFYKKKYKEYKDNNTLTLEESYKILIEDGIWKKDMDEEIKSLTSSTNELRKKIPSLKYLKAQQKVAKDTIAKSTKRINELSRIKNQLWPYTIEYFCTVEKRKFILSRITSFLNDDNVDLLKNPSFLLVLSVYYYEDNAVSLNIIRELARSDPWRLYWTVSKETGTSLFPHSSVEMTELQYALITWSRVYDFAYESQNRPSDDVISDDDLFDSWYEIECERIKKQIQDNSKDTNISGAGSVETFIVADEEGAKEVYALNNPIIRKDMQERQKIIEKKGYIKEEELPDVKNRMRMIANQLSQNRS